MSSIRLILRSLQNTSRFRAERSFYGISAQQRFHRGLYNHTVVTSKTFCRSFATTTTLTTDTSDTNNETTSTSDLLESLDIDQPQLLESAIKIDDRSSDEVWETYTQLANDPTVTLTKYDYISVCVALKRDKASPDSIKRIQILLKRIHEQGNMHDTFVRCCNMLIYLYIEHGTLDSARLVFSGMLRSKYEPTNVTINSLLDGIAKLGTAKDAMVLYQSLSQQGLFPDSIDTYHRLIKVLGITFGDIDSSLMLFTKMQQSNGTLTPDIAIYNTILTIYQNAKQPERAWAFYSQQIMTNVTPDGATYYTLIKTLQKKKKDNVDRIQGLYNEMKRLGIPIRAAHYQVMEWDAMEALDELKKDGCQLSVYDYNTLIVSAVKNNQFGDALSIFKEMSKGEDELDSVTPDAYTYGIIMDALVKDVEQPAMAVYDIYEEMKERHITPDVVTYSCLIQACGKDDDMDRAVGYLDEMQQLKIQPNTYILNTFLGALGRKSVKEKHDMYCARALWDQMIAIRVYPDTRSFNQYLSLLSQFVPVVNPNELKASRDLQHQDNGSGQHDLFYDELDVPESIMGMPMSGTAKYMMKIYKTMRHSKHNTSRPDFLSYSILINTMVNHGQTRQAMLLFRDAQQANKRLGVNVYNTIMQGLLRDNDLHQVMYVWQDMKINRVLPDPLSYELVLDACEQLHLVESLKTILDQRKQDTNRLQHLEDEREKRWSRAKSIKERRGTHDGR